MHYGFQEWTMQESRHKHELKQNFVKKACHVMILGREKFVEETWKWKEEYAGHIREQWAKLGLRS